jgi:hypothetical protein
MLKEVLKYCQDKGWATKYHKDLDAWALSYDIKTAQCWLNSIGIKFIDNQIRITMIGGYIGLFDSAEMACKQLDYMMN